MQQGKHYRLCTLLRCVICLNAAARILVEVGVTAVRQRSFPPGFRFGAATSAYQIEGGWNASDKSESIWDRYVHTHRGCSGELCTGDVASDSYHLWRKDVQLAENLGLDFYSFSISWPRLLPSGFANHISEDGSRYYGELIDHLLRVGVRPVVTLFHWDLPQSLQDLGGWTNPLIADWFEDYSYVVFNLYADRVKTWITINEPMSLCEGGYSKLLAPGFLDYKIGALLCSKHTLLAHAKAYRIYEKNFKALYDGQVSIANQEMWLEPVSRKDHEIASLARDHAFGRYSYPIFSATGGWPPALEEYIANKSRMEGYPSSRLPAFTQSEIEMLRGSADFFALNYFSSGAVRKATEDEDMRTFLIQGIEELEAVLVGHPESVQDMSAWRLGYPEGLRKNLQLIKQQYGNVTILITENGYSDTSADLDDQARVQYHKDYLEQVLEAIYEDDVNVVGYTAWSLLDHFDWKDGYQSYFGLHAVDFLDPLRRRTPRASAHFYANVVRTRCLPLSPPRSINKVYKLGIHDRSYKPHRAALRQNRSVNVKTLAFKNTRNGWTLDFQMVGKPARRANAQFEWNYREYRNSMLEHARLRAKPKTSS